MKQQAAATTLTAALPRVDHRQRRRQIKALCDAIARQFRPEKIILFGSYAYGRPNQDSDVDLLVIMPFEGSPFHQAATILNGVMSHLGVFSLDLLVRTSEQVHERLAIDDCFMREVIERGKVMYEANHA